MYKYLNLVLKPYDDLRKYSINDTPKMNFFFFFWGGGGGVFEGTNVYKYSTKLSTPSIIVSLQDSLLNFMINSKAIFFSLQHKKTLQVEHLLSSFDSTLFWLQTSHLPLPLTYITQWHPKFSRRILLLTE